MDRVTKRAFDFTADFAASNLQRFAIAEALQKLQHYEDLEEDGKLMILPCKEGDTLYCVTRRQVKPFVVAGFEMFGKSLCVMEKIKRGWKVRLYGTNAFLTEEEAGAHLQSKERAKDEQKQP